MRKSRFGILALLSVFLLSSCAREAPREEQKPILPAAPEALGSIGQVAVPALIQALKGEDWQVRLSAARALGRIGPEAKAAVPALTEALKYEDSDVREAAAEALKKIRGEE